MDLSAIVESLQHGIREVPPVAIALVLLAGPTVALIGYRMVGAARRTHTSPTVEVVARWVCSDCRSVNELRASRCYRCGVESDRAGEVEIVVDQPATPASPVHVPAGSPFAAVAMGGREGPGVPVMADRSTSAHPVAIGPGRELDGSVGVADASQAEPVEAER